MKALAFLAAVGRATRVVGATTRAEKMETDTILPSGIPGTEPTRTGPRLRHRLPRTFNGLK